MRSGYLWRTCAFIAALMIAAGLAAEAAAQTTEPQQAAPEVQQLKDRLKLLEQTVQELKGQITSLEQSQKTVSATAPTAPGGPAPKPAAQESKSQSTMEIYGSVMLDAGYDFNQSHPDWFDTMRPSKLPSYKDEFGPDGKVFYGVRQTRFGAKTTTPTQFGELKTIFEFELFGTGVDAGQTTFRLRHAYGELGHFGAGQTWSAFMDPDVFPNSFEYWGPTGTLWFRNVQFRWMPIQGRNRLTIALERPGASADQGVYADRIELKGVKPKFDLPDLTWHARLGRSWGYVQLAGILKKMKWVDMNNDGIDLSGSDVGWGFSLSSSLNLGKRDVARLQAIYGEGIQNYMNDAPADVGIKNNFGDPLHPVKGVALPILGLVSFLDHTWSEHFTSTFGYSFQNIENSDGQSPQAFHRGHYGLTNLLYSPVPNVTIGVEYQWGRRENFGDGWKADDNRLQFGFKYNFSKPLSF